MPCTNLLHKYESQQQHNIRQDGFTIEQQVQLKSHAWNVSCLQFSTNGKQLASGSWDKTIHVWNLNCLDEPCRRLGSSVKVHRSPVTCFTWLPQSDCLLLSGSADASLVLWNTETGEAIDKLEEHESWVLGMSSSSDGQLLASSCWYGDVILWDVNLLKPLCKLLGHNKGVWSCCFSPSSTSTLCTASEDCSLRIWDMRGEKSWHSDMVLSGVHRYAIKTCAWSPCGNYLAAGSRDQNIDSLIKGLTSDKIRGSKWGAKGGVQGVLLNDFIRRHN